MACIEIAADALWFGSRFEMFTILDRLIAEVPEGSLLHARLADKGQRAVCHVRLDGLPAAEYGELQRLVEMLHGEYATAPGSGGENLEARQGLLQRLETLMELLRRQASAALLP